MPLNIKKETKIEKKLITASNEREIFYEEENQPMKQISSGSNILNRIIKKGDREKIQVISARKIERNINPVERSGERPGDEIVKKPKTGNQVSRYNKIQIKLSIIDNEDKMK